MIIKKRVGDRNFVQYLGLKDTYSLGTKAKRKKQEFLKGGPGYVYYVQKRFNESHDY